MGLPYQLAFGPSRRRWSRRVGTMAAADFCSHGLGFPSPPPPFRQALLTGTLTDLPE